MHRPGDPKTAVSCGSPRSPFSLEVTRGGGYGMSRTVWTTPATVCSLTLRRCPIGGSLYDDGLGLERRPRGIPGQRLVARSLIGGSRNTWRYTLAGYRAHSAASATNALAWSSLEEIKVATALVKHQRAGGEVGFQKRGGLDRDGGEQPSLGPHCGRGTPARDVRCFESCLVDWGFDGMAGGLEH